MRSTRLLIPGLILLLSACAPKQEPAAPEAETAIKPTAADADAFIADINAFLKSETPRLAAAHWMSNTHISPDSQLLAAHATEEVLEYQTRKADEAKQFDGVEGLSDDTARALMLVKLGSPMPAPSDAEKRKEVARLSAKMEANYGAAKWCRSESGEDCLSLQQIEKIIDNVKLENSPDEMLEAWLGWRETAKPIRQDYLRFAELMSQGAQEMGFANAAELWRAGYDMSPAEFESEVERLWGQVEPLYEQIHCAVRAKLNEKYGDELAPADGMIPAHLLGNMWAQTWGNLYPLMAPYPELGDLNVSAPLEAARDKTYRKLLADFDGRPTPQDLVQIERQAERDYAVEMTRTAEDFYTSLGLPALPDSFWEKSLLTKPMDREVVCHASAWDMNLDGDVRIKQCIEPSEEQLTTIHHELGHVFYYLAYNHLPPIFQSGAHDGFHEAIGDTITLSLTPAHLQEIGLLKNAEQSEQALINRQMKLALDKLVFLPWGKLVDQWRWKLFAGETSEEDLNASWWALRERYQGVTAPAARSEDDFDPGAKYHIPGNTPYTRYFLAFILQFQLQKALCETAGHEGPLHSCNIYGSKQAGQKLQDMLALGASQPWPDTLEKLTGTRQMDAGAITEYFQPLLDYLEAQNQDRSCGWGGDDTREEPAVVE